MDGPAESPRDGSREIPNVARMYDYFLDGHHNLAADRRAAEQVLAINPDARSIAQANRAFLRRAVTFLGERGIDQFLDLGSGIPTAGNVHEVAQATDPAARVAYVDREPVAVAYSQAILADNPHAIAIQADARQPAAILAHPEVRRLLDFDRPVAVLLIAVLHFVTDDGEAYGLARGLRDALAPGSFLALAHATDEGVPREVVARGERLYTRTSNPLKARPRAAIAAFFDGWELAEPGLVYAPAWRPEDPRDVFFAAPARAVHFAGVARKP